MLTEDDLKQIQGMIDVAAKSTVEQLTETMRDMQSELLRGMEAFARGNFSRMQIQDTRIAGVD